MSLLEKIKITNFKTIPLIKNNEQSNFNANTLKYQIKKIIPI